MVIEGEEKGQNGKWHNSIVVNIVGTHVGIEEEKEALLFLDWHADLAER